MASLTPVTPPDIGCIVTYLEMRQAPKPRPLPVMAALRLDHWRDVDRDRYRQLFRAVGAPWLWASRLAMTDEVLDGILQSPDVEVHAAARRDGTAVGILELDFREKGQCEIAFFGLVPSMTGKGFGTWLMAQALTLAWRKGIERVWLHSCTLDHPNAIGFYESQGFKTYARAVEIFPDPRLSGLLPRDCAPHIAVLEG